MSSTDECQWRADGWLRWRTRSLLEVEPDWWLRMSCGQIADGDGFSNPKHHARQKLRRLVHGSGGPLAMPT